MEWTLVRTQVAAVVDAIAWFVPGGRSQHPLRVGVGALLVVHLTMLLPEALREVADRPASELKQFNPRRPVFGDPARWQLLDQFYYY